MTSPGSPAVESSAPTGHDSVRPKVLPRTLPRRAELLHGLAQATYSVHLRTAALAIAGTDEDVAAPRLLAGTFPDKIAGGRDIPQRFAFQVENAWPRLKQYGLFPDHSGLHFDSIVGVGVAVAKWDANGDEDKADKRPYLVGSTCTVRQIARDARKDPKTVSRALRWLRENGLLDVGPRWRTTDREEEVPGVPATWHRSTVKLLHLAPLELAKQLTFDDLLDLVAAQNAKPEIPPLPPPPSSASNEVAAAANDVERSGCFEAPAAAGAIPAAAGPVTTRSPASETPGSPPSSRPSSAPSALANRPPRKPKRLSVRKILDTFGYPALPEGADLRPLVGPLAELSKRSVTPIPPELAARLAMHHGLENWHEAANAVRELARDAHDEAVAARLDGQLPIAWHLGRVVKALAAYFRSKLRWITTGPGALAARQLVAVEEAERERDKAAEQLSAARAAHALQGVFDAAPQNVPQGAPAAPRLTAQQQKLRFAFLYAETQDDRARAAAALRRAGMPVPELDDLDDSDGIFGPPPRGPPE